MAGMKYVANCSFGKDSLAMLLKLIEDNKSLDDVLFFDTGMEYQSIYNNRDKIKDLLKERNIKFTQICAKNSFYYDMLVRPIKYKDQKDKIYPYHYGYGWCGKLRWATTYKISEAKKYYNNEYPNEEITEYVGIAFDEQERVKESDSKSRIIKSYPLIEYEMTEKDCLQYCYDKGYNWDENGIELYSILDRVSCWCCQNKNLKELKNMYMYLPDYWQKLRGLQDRIDEPMKGKGKSVFELEERFRKEIENDKI